MAIGVPDQAAHRADAHRAAAVVPARPRCPLFRPPRCPSAGVPRNTQLPEQSDARHEFESSIGTTIAPGSRISGGQIVSHLSAPVTPCHFGPVNSMRATGGSARFPVSSSSSWPLQATPPSRVQPTASARSRAAHLPGVMERSPHIGAPDKGHATAAALHRQGAVDAARRDAAAPQPGTAVGAVRASSSPTTATVPRDSRRPRSARRTRPARDAHATHNRGKTLKPRAHVAVDQASADRRPVRAVLDDVGVEVQAPREDEAVVEAPVVLDGQRPGAV